MLHSRERPQQPAAALQVACQPSKHRGEYPVVDPRGVDSFPQDEPIADNRNLPVAVLAHDLGPNFRLALVQLAVEPHVLSVDMRGAYSRLLELLAEPQRLLDAWCEQQGRQCIWIQLLPPLVHTAKDRGGHNHLPHVAFRKLPGGLRLDMSGVRLVWSVGVAREQ